MDVENKFMLPVGKRVINWEIGVDIHTLLCIKQISNKDLLLSTENSAQYSVKACMGKDSKKKCEYICITDSLYRAPETNTAL